MADKRIEIVPKGESGWFVIKGITPPPATNGIEVFYGQKKEIISVEAPELWTIRAHLNDGCVYDYDVTNLAKAGGPWRALRADPDAYFSCIEAQPKWIIWRVSDDEQQCPRVPLEVILRDGQRVE
ncbi:hypothetical protein Heshes_24320 [Alicyclobacillus hesperidum]|uniref:Uncharacterized protein n=1 Tax=Alicyclobacillus hesperidum TaxID=89784 RepID=A0A1H2X540_9BACL|nr:hypothetical protein [Alicyclobacillus hesperidum]GLV14748.1 hypothetical protein Heshes_24320 [Alicyclobacillus hesperidum]SDW88000.1 hypothetical protein SAMN04489725_11847 [Alicyclobacillus hesperidum]